VTETNKEKTMTTWTEIVDPAAFAAASALARGCYQTALLEGYEALSGSTLKGKAASYGSHYAQSRKALLGRMTAAGIAWSERRGPRGRRILVIGA